MIFLNVDAIAFVDFGIISYIVIIVFKGKCKDLIYV